MAKKILRSIVLIFLIILALSGVGVGGILQRRERPQDNEVRLELVEEKKDEEDDNEE